MIFFITTEQKRMATHLHRRHFCVTVTFFLFEQRESISSFNNESHQKDQGCSESLEEQEEGGQVQVVPWPRPKVAESTVSLK
jgi:hypothetical protein